MEARGDVLIHLDREVLLIDYGGVALGDALLDPIDERLAEHGGSNITDPCLRNLAQLLAFGHELQDSLVLLEKGEDLLHAKVLVGRYLNVNDVRHAHILLCARDDVLQEVCQDKVSRAFDTYKL